MDVAEYRKSNKAGWVIQAVAGCTGSFVSPCWDSGCTTEDLESALAFDNHFEASFLSKTLTRTTTSTWRPMLISALPKKDTTGKIKEDLEFAIRSIGQFDSCSLTYHGIAQVMYELIVRIIQQQAKQ